MTISVKIVKGGGEQESRRKVLTCKIWTKKDLNVATFIAAEGLKVIKKQIMNI